MCQYPIDITWGRCERSLNIIIIQQDVIFSKCNLLNFKETRNKKQEVIKINKENHYWILICCSNLAVVQTKLPYNVIRLDCANINS